MGVPQYRKPLVQMDKWMDGWMDGALKHLPMDRFWLQTNSQRLS
jgi:hypothetical protein